MGIVESLGRVRSPSQADKPVSPARQTWSYFSQADEVGRVSTASPEDAQGVTAVRAGLLAEAGGVAHVLDGQLREEGRKKE